MKLKYSNITLWASVIMTSASWFVEGDAPAFLLACACALVCTSMICRTIEETQP